MIQDHSDHGVRNQSILIQKVDSLVPLMHHDLSDLHVGYIDPDLDHHKGTHPK